MAKKKLGLMSLGELKTMVPTTGSQNSLTMSEEEIEARELNFINGAPDGKKNQEDPLKGISTGVRRTSSELKKKGRKIPVTITFSPEMLDRLDEAASDLGMTRTGYIALLVRNKLGLV